MMKNLLGVSIALLIMCLWGGSLVYLLAYFTIAYDTPLTYGLVLLQTHLYTGLFITAHDAMHHTVTKNRHLNHAIGTVAALLFAFNTYHVLIKKHHQHHRFVATAQDPDYHEGSFWIWYYHFAKSYVTIWQILAMGIAFNVLQLIVPDTNLILFWMLPAVLSTLQLFYFGTYLPHKNAPNNVHHARSLSKNHWWAFLSCYFFGYHYEHHDLPNLPWWLLWKAKEDNLQARS